MNREKEKLENSDLPKPDILGGYGPNDGGYIHQRVVNCAKEIRRAQILYSEGHYAHSNARTIPQDHPLRVVMEQLGKLDQEYAVYANTTPNKELFSTYEPPFESTQRLEEPQVVSYCQYIYSADKINWALRPHPIHRYLVNILMSNRTLKPIDEQTILIEPMDRRNLIMDFDIKPFKIPNELIQLAPFKHEFEIDLSQY